MTIRWCEPAARRVGDARPSAAIASRAVMRRLSASIAVAVSSFRSRHLFDGCWRDDLDTGVSGRSAIETCLQCAVIHDEAHRLRASIFMIELQKERRSTLRREYP